MSYIFRVYIVVYACIAILLFFVLQFLVVDILALIVALCIVFALSGQITKRALRRYRLTICILQDIIHRSPTDIQELLPDFDNILVSLKSLIEDSTETVEQAKHRQKTIAKILDTTQEGLLLLDRNYKILMANKSGLSLFNIERIHKRYTFIQLYRNESVITALKSLKDTGPVVLDIEKDGEIYQLNFNIAAGGYTIFTKNVTDTIRMEQLQREFSSNVSHALKTPLTSISGFAELLHRGMVTDPEKIAQHSYKIYTETQRLIALVDDILRMSHLEDTVSAAAEQLQVQDIVTNALDILSQKIEGKMLTVTVIGKGQAPIKYSHMVELTTNLLDNAVKYNKHRGHIDITIEECAKLVLTVSDTGIGIDEDKLPFIFERFYRVPSSTQGNGLGLSIVDTIIKLYKGSITVTSIKGKGTTFRVELLKN